MSVTAARVALASDAYEGGAQTRAWRPFPTDVADILCVEESGPDVAPRIHGRFSITVIRSAAVVRCESSRSLVAAQNSVLLVPALQLSSLRVQGRPTGGTVTMLVRASHPNGLEATDGAALATDVALVEQVDALVNQLLRPVVSLECATTMRTLLGRLTSSAAPVGSMLPRQGTPLVPARDYLRDHLSLVRPPGFAARLMRRSSGPVFGGGRAVPRTPRVDDGRAPRSGASGALAHRAGPRGGTRPHRLAGPHWGDGRRDRHHTRRGSGDGPPLVEALQRWRRGGP